MSKRTNEELMALHEAGKPHPKSDDARLCRLIAAAHANKLVQAIETARRESKLVELEKIGDDWPTFFIS